MFHLVSCCLPKHPNTGQPLVHTEEEKQLKGEKSQSVLLRGILGCRLNYTCKAKWLVKDFLPSGGKKNVMSYTLGLKKEKKILPKHRKKRILPFSSEFLDTGKARPCVTGSHLHKAEWDSLSAEIYRGRWLGEKPTPMSKCEHVSGVCKGPK